MTSLKLKVSWWNWLTDTVKLSSQHLSSPQSVRTNLLVVKNWLSLWRIELPVPATEDCLERIVVGYPFSLSLALTGRLIDLRMRKHFNKSLTSPLTADRSGSNLLRFNDFLPLPDLLLRLPLLRMESKEVVVTCNSPVSKVQSHYKMRVLTTMNYLTSHFSQV